MSSITLSLGCVRKNGSVAVVDCEWIPSALSDWFGFVPFFLVVAYIGGEEWIRRIKKKDC
jgi:hypothetical protein